MSEESRKHNSHAAESWRELAGDVRQWTDGHRLAITATVALVVLNLVVWLVVAMAGFAFPLRLDTSMAEFDFGKLFCTLFLARGVIQLRHRHFAGFNQARKIFAVILIAHTHVDAGLDRHAHRIFRIGGGTVLNQFFDRTVIGNGDALKAPLITQHVF